jgi:hypothetical protein
MDEGIRTLPLIDGPAEEVLGLEWPSQEVEDDSLVVDHDRVVDQVPVLLMVVLLLVLLLAVLVVVVLSHLVDELL